MINMTLLSSSIEELFTKMNKESLDDYTIPKWRPFHSLTQYQVKVIHLIQLEWLLEQFRKEMGLRIISLQNELLVPLISLEIVNNILPSLIFPDMTCFYIKIVEKIKPINHDDYKDICIYLENIIVQEKLQLIAEINSHTSVDEKIIKLDTALPKTVQLTAFNYTTTMQLKEKFLLLASQMGELKVNLLNGSIDSPERLRASSPLSSNDEIDLKHTVNTEQASLWYNTINRIQNLYQKQEELQHIEERNNFLIILNKLMVIVQPHLISENKELIEKVLMALEIIPLDFSNSNALCFLADAELSNIGKINYILATLEQEICNFEQPNQDESESELPITQFHSLPQPVNLSLSQWGTFPVPNTPERNEVDDWRNKVRLSQTLTDKEKENLLNLLQNTDDNDLLNNIILHVETMLNPPKKPTLNL